jgi:NADH:ubiquinone oxidoreductase subunit 2 (subunit N)
LAIGLMAAITCTVGNLSAFRQDNLKRLLAYSSIAHAGYMLMAVAILWRPLSESDQAHPAYAAIGFYLIVYLFMNLGAFGIVAMVYWSTGRETIDTFVGLGRRNPALAVMMVVCLFSLVGLPPFGGFMAKWYLLFALYEGGLVWLVIIAVLNTLISLYYYARIAYAMYFAPDPGEPAIRAPGLGQLMAGVCAAVIILSCTLVAGRLKDFADARATNLHAVGDTSQASHAAARRLPADQTPAPESIQRPPMLTAEAGAVSERAPTRKVWPPSHAGSNRP